MGRVCDFGARGVIVLAIAVGVLGSAFGSDRVDLQCDRVMQLVPLAEKLRGLSARKPIRCRELDSAAYGRRVRRLLSDLNPPRLLQYDERISKLLGIIPKDYAYSSCMTSGQDDASWALYDRQAHEVVVRSDQPTPDAILVHEIVHAIQDQHFDLTKLHRGARSSDRGMAVAALIEGDAIDIEGQVLPSAAKVEGSSGSGFAEGCDPPEGLFNSLMFVYEWGGRFLKDLPDRNRAFENPPCSTRGILYPKEYLSKVIQECPVLAPQPSPGGGWRLDHHDTLGEFIVRNWMKGFVSPGAAILAAKGLKADRVELFRRGEGGEFVRWTAEFDSAGDADQMLEALRAMSAKRSGESLRGSAAGWRVLTVDGEMISVLREGRRVRVLVEGRGRGRRSSLELGSK